MDNRVKNDLYEKIGQELINTEPELRYIKNSCVSIIYLSSDKQMKTRLKKTYAQCEKIQDKYKWGLPCDFTITVFEPNVADFNDEQIKILIFHELLHVGIDVTEKGEERYFCAPHDLEDFKAIIDRYGTEWSKV